MKFSDLIEETRKAYMSKNELIEMLTNIEFICVRSCDLELITGFKIKPKKDSDESFYESLYKSIKIF